METAGNAPAATDPAKIICTLVLSPYLVPGVRIERTPPDFQSGAMTSSATRANWSGQRESNPRLLVGSQWLYH